MENHTIARPALAAPAEAAPTVRHAFDAWRLCNQRMIDCNQRMVADGSPSPEDEAAFDEIVEEVFACARAVFAAPAESDADLLMKLHTAACEHDLFPGADELAPLAAEMRAWVERMA